MPEHVGVEQVGLTSSKRLAIGLVAAEIVDDGSRRREEFAARRVRVQVKRGNRSINKSPRQPSVAFRQYVKSIKPDGSRREAWSTQVFPTPGSPKHRAQAMLPRFGDELPGARGGVVDLLREWRTSEREGREAHQKMHLAAASSCKACTGLKFTGLLARSGAGGQRGGGGPFRVADRIHEMKRDLLSSSSLDDRTLAIEETRRDRDDLAGEISERHLMTTPPTETVLSRDAPRAHGEGGAELLLGDWALSRLRRRAAGVRPREPGMQGYLTREPGPESSASSSGRRCRCDLERIRTPEPLHFPRARGIP